MESLRYGRAVIIGWLFHLLLVHPQLRQDGGSRAAHHTLTQAYAKVERDRGMRKRDIPFSFTAGTRFVINPQAFPHFTSSPSISVMVPVSSNPYVNTIHLRPKQDPYSVSYFAGVCYLVCGCCRWGNHKEERERFYKGQFGKEYGGTLMKLSD